MGERTETSKLLNMMIQPGFCVEDGVITCLNPAARALALDAGMAVEPLLATGQGELADLTEGCLYLQLALGGDGRGAAVIPMEGRLLFLLDPEGGAMDAYALASQMLRTPAGTILYASDRIAKSAAASGDPEAIAQVGELNRGIFQLMRIVNNMSDLLLYSTMSRQEMRNLTALFAEVFEKAQGMLAQAELELTYQGPREDIFAMADEQQLERAVLNLLSNAAKFNAPGGKIHASLTRRGEMLRLSVTDNGAGIAEDILPGIFHRYLRAPGLEDPRHGLGLGLALIRSAAVNHGGTVLIDRVGGAARVTMTVAIRQERSPRLRCPAAGFDYASEWDHALVELSQILPASLYERK